jgi:hypothetical protein
MVLTLAAEPDSHKTRGKYTGQLGAVSFLHRIRFSGMLEVLEDAISRIAEEALSNPPAIGIMRK